MSARLRKLGFVKSPIQITRNGLSYKHPDASALFTFGKPMASSVHVTAPDHPQWSFAFLTIDTWERIQQNPWVVLPWEEPEDGVEQPLCHREILLCWARGFADMLAESGEE
jgi:hypothetical protein